MMMHKNRVLSLLLLTGLMSCKPKAQVAVPNDPPAALVGRWEAEGLTVLPDYLGPASKPFEFDSRSVQNAGRRPMITVIDPTGAFREEEWSLSDSLLRVRKGYWHQNGDSLYWTHEGDAGKRASFGMELSKFKLKLSAVVDYDGDSQRDDLLEIRMTRK